jgi:deoxyribose-phosphate aldolase
MTRAELAACLEHSVLRPESTAADLQDGARIVVDWRIARYCVQPAWVGAAVTALAGRGDVVAVVGFPHGLDQPSVKAAAARAAVDAGAREIDMVLNVGALKSGWADAVARDIAAVVEAVPSVPVKVILEAAVLSESEKRLACRIARSAGAAFVKTSTGFHPAGGATLADVRLLRAEVGRALGVKASGGIRPLADALAMIEAGADRVGTSASAAILDALVA